MDPSEAALLRLLLSPLLLLALLACPEGAAQLLPPFPSSPALSAPSPGVMAAPFQVEPYLQLGAGPSSPDRLALLWHAQDGLSDWTVEIKPQSGEDWTRMAPPVSVLVDTPGSRCHRVWSAALTPLGPGLPFDYRVLLGGKARPSRPRASPRRWWWPATWRERIRWGPRPWSA